MKAFSESYRCLARDLFGLSGLWLGEDHLVYVKGSGFLVPFSEEYKRFRFSEIQAVNVAKTSRTGWSLLYLSGLLLSSLVVTLVLVLAESMAPATVMGLSLAFALGLASLALLVRHLILGPTCLCDVQTRLSRERIRPLNRYHRTLETVRRIEGLVRESQAGIPVWESTGGGAATITTGSRGADFYQVPFIVPVVYGIFLVLGFAGLASLHLESTGVTAFVLLLILAGSLALTLALIAVVRKPTPDSLRAVLWLLLGMHFLVIGIGMVYFIVVATGEPAYTVGVTGPLEAFTVIAMEGGVWLYGVFVLLLAGMIGASATGLILNTGWRRKIRLAAALASGAGKDTRHTDATDATVATEKGVAAAPPLPAPPPTREDSDTP